MDVPKKSRERAGGNFSEKVKITFNHTCKILCDIWVKHLDSAAVFYCYSDLISINWGGSVSRVLFGIYNALLKCSNIPSCLTLYPKVVLSAQPGFL